ncbi:hypothetical protein [Actinomycetospora cinnamomea]|uniref:Uncharacterized protein n=1 Tax=Actinomycetospora cinnamomea TaxID=663609 RepID=A0A2U1F3S1_9PSEU|nr:hypothetical protein [Actinomycetospora cinnamomea]PVZ06824.1 hypothetical protein C8D89_11217 [Actinomycetospora cinnamomea]
MDSTTDSRRRVVDHAGVGIGRAGDDGWVTDFAGVRIGRVLDDGIVEDFSHVHIGMLDGAPRHAAAA